MSLPCRVTGEEAEQGAWVEIVLLAPHALKPGAEALLLAVALEQLLPRLALHAATAPVELEQDVGVEVRVELVHVDGNLLYAPERRRRDGHVRAHGRPHGRVGRVELLGLRALLAERARVAQDLGPQRSRALVVDQLVHHSEPLEGVLAVEDARLVDVVRTPSRADRGCGRRSRG
jgi:hypothetical protein